MPTGPGLDDVGEAEAEAADDRGAAVGAHHQQAALGGGLLERDLLLDRHVVAEDHHVVARRRGRPSPRRARSRRAPRPARARRAGAAQGARRWCAAAPPRSARVRRGGWRRPGRRSTPARAPVEGAVVVEAERDDHVVGRRLGGTSKPISVEHLDVERRWPSRPGRRATPSTPWTARLTWSSVTESAYAPGRVARRGVVMRRAAPSWPRSVESASRAPRQQAGAGGVADRRAARAGARAPRRRCRARRAYAANSREHLAVQRAVEQRRRQQRGAVEAARGPPRRPSAVGDAGGAVHGQPAAQHVVAERRQPVAAAEPRAGGVGRAGQAR